MSWSHVVVHHSAGHDTPALDLAAIDHFHEIGRGWRDVGYHFLVENVGGYYVAVAGRPLTWAGSHEPKANRTGIGVCFVGNFSEESLPQEQLEAGAKLIAGLLVLLGVPLGTDVTSLILPHRHYKATECPGRLFPLSELIALVTKLVSEAEV